MKRLVLATALTALTALAIGGCGDGFDTAEATAACDADEKNMPNCFDDDAYAQCIACHEECGDTCATIDTVCPAQFTCPAD